MVIARDLALKQWVITQLDDAQLTISPLAGDASFRRYARILSKQRSYMLMDAPPEQEDSQPFVAIDRFMDEHGVNVPHIVAQDLAQGFILLEDFGDCLLSTVLTGHSADAFYAQAMQQLIHLQQLPTNTALIPAYSADKLQQEMTLFDEWFLPYLDVQLTAAEQAVLQHAYGILVQAAMAQPQVVVHRDYHCRNLMVVEGSSALGVIDFQDAVVGAYTYDLASILRDAYVSWSDDKVRQWVAEFWQQLPDAHKQHTTLQGFYREFDLMAAQRHLKVLGIFIRLNTRDGKTGYMKDIPLVFAYLLHELAAYAELSDFHQLLVNKVRPAFLQKFVGAHTVLESFAV